MPKKVDIFSKLNPLTLFERYSYDVPSAICEFIDNSIANFEKNERLLAKSSSQSANPKLKINIIYDTSSHYSDSHSLIIEDNSMGMTTDELAQGLIIQNAPSVQNNLNRYGVGMKSAIAWLGDACEIETSPLGSQNKSFVYLDIPKLGQTKEAVEIIEKFEKADRHYTVITVSKLKPILKLGQMRKIVEKIQLIYALKLKRIFKIEIRVCTKEDLAYYDVPEKNQDRKMFNSCEDIPPITHQDRNIWINSETKEPYKWKLQDSILDQEKVYDFSGYFAIDEKVADGGVYLYIAERLIEILPPNNVFGKGNPYRKVFAEIECRGDWIESQTKDKIIFKGDFEKKFLDYLQQFLKQKQILQTAASLKDEEKKIDLEKFKKELDKKLKILEFDPHGIELKISQDDSKKIFSLQRIDEHWELTFYINHPLILQWLQSPTKKANELLAIVFLAFNTVFVSLEESIVKIEQFVASVNTFLLKFLKKDKKPDKTTPQTPTDKKPSQSESEENTLKSSTPEKESFVQEVNADLPPRDFFQTFIGDDSDQQPEKTLAVELIAKQQAQIIDKILFENKIEAKVRSWFIGAQIIHYQIYCPDKIKKITKIEDEFKHKLGERRIYFHEVTSRMSFLGVDVPLKTEFKTAVFWNKFIGQTNPTKDNLAFPAGQNVEGKIDQLSLNENTPHLLIAGSTGQGKSVALLSILASLLFNNTPQTLKLVLVDVKKVELSFFQDLPHLFCPIVTQAELAMTVFEKVLAEIERRLTLLRKELCNKSTEYNKKVSSKDKLPDIVVVIDEFADLILQKKNDDIEQSVIRICQIGRAAGVHMIIATQRPSVDVVSGLIKTNVQGRLALNVSNSHDSKTILDCSGAEKLLGKGDMLSSQPGQEPNRLQGLFISADEIDALVSFWTKK